MKLRIGMGRPIRIGYIAAVLVVAILMTPWLVIRASSSGDVSPLADGSATGEAAIVLGTLVNEDGSLSPRLAERVETAVELHRTGAVPVLVMSGTGLSDTGQDEPARMRDYAIELGVPAADILLDGGGFDTLASCRNAAHTFGFDTVVLVTSEFHTYRAVWLCEHVGLQAQAVHAPIQLGWTVMRKNAREFAAAWKAVLEVAAGHAEG